MTNDIAVTDREIDNAYGVAPTRTEIDIAVGSAAASFDADDLSEGIYGKFEAIAEALANRDYELVGLLVDLTRRQCVAARASKVVYGRPTAITADEVKV